jgi:16S rRNA C967 or C1407 C5-methylase (RsmB/RsmF family)/NOL1/NOP2/fmu family ribosome biogenesis protein
MQKIISNIPSTILSDEKKKILLNAVETSEPQYSIRLNSKKFKHELNLEKVNWCKNAYYVKDKPRFSMDPLWHAGAYYVQEAGSMFLSSIIEALPFENKPTHVLDLCAAPGGKTTLMADVLPEDCVIVANEMIPQRLKSLHENIIKWGNSNIITTNNQPTAFENLPNYFDLVLVDAPCSGEGLLRRNDEALNQWSPKLIEECCYKQKQILSSALETLKPGGFLIYSTCTYNTTENEDNLTWLINENNCLPVDLQMILPSEITVTETLGNKAYRFFPGITMSEGFFITVVQKQNDHSGDKHWSNKTTKIKYAANPMKELIEFNQRSVLVEEKGMLKFYSEKVLEGLIHLDKHLKINDAARDFGTVKNNKFIPAETLGFANSINIDESLIADLNYDDAILFLSRGNLQLTVEKRGYTFLRFNGVIVGLANILENRLNNYYPNHWRILNVDKEKAFSISNTFNRKER